MTLTRFPVLEVDVVSGSIILWSGSIVSIPSGYVLCDGNNGTPDLRDKFIRGAGSSYNPGDTGGQNTHTHTFIGNSHTHQIQTGKDVAQSGASYNATSTGTQVSGTNSVESNQPPYYALAYIMKT